jgi:hypothetical protein
VSGAQAFDPPRIGKPVTVTVAGFFFVPVLAACRGSRTAFMSQIGNCFRDSPDGSAISIETASFGLTFDLLWRLAGLRWG